MATDPLEDPTIRSFVTGVLIVYVGLIAIELTTGNQLAGAASDVVVAVFVLVASTYLFQLTGFSDPIIVLTGLVFGLAGVTSLYVAAAKLAVVPASTTIDLVASVSLLAGFLLYLYRREEIHMPR